MLLQHLLNRAIAWLNAGQPADAAAEIADSIARDPADNALHADPERGQGLVEYALILVLVVLVAFVVLVVAGPWVGNMFSNVVNTL